MIGGERQQLCHRCNRGGMRDRLPLADGQHTVLISQFPECLWNEKMPGNLPHGRHDPGIVQDLTLEPGNHFLAGQLEFEMFRDMSHDYPGLWFGEIRLSRESSGAFDDEI